MGWGWGWGETGAILDVTEPWDERGRRARQAHLADVDGTSVVHEPRSDELWKSLKR